MWQSPDGQLRHFCPGGELDAPGRKEVIGDMEFVLPSAPPEGWKRVTRYDKALEPELRDNLKRHAKLPEHLFPAIEELQRSAQFLKTQV
jgi:hypothetical protein